MHGHSRAVQRGLFQHLSVRLVEHICVGSSNVVRSYLTLAGWLLFVCTPCFTRLYYRSICRLFVKSPHVHCPHYTLVTGSPPTPHTSHYTLSVLRVNVSHRLSQHSCYIPALVSVCVALLGVTSFQLFHIW